MRVSVEAKTAQVFEAFKLPFHTALGFLKGSLDGAEIFSHNSLPGVAFLVKAYMVGPFETEHIKHGRLPYVASNMKDFVPEIGKHRVNIRQFAKIMHCSLFNVPDCGKLYGERVRVRG